MATGGKEEITQSNFQKNAMKLAKYLDSTIEERKLPREDSSIRIEKIKQSFGGQVVWKDLHWYRDASPSQRVQLRDFLIELDLQNRVDPQSDRTKDIRDGVHRIMTALTEKIEQIQPRLGGKLFPVGSSHNETKVGKPDEFDFIYELNACTLLGDKSASTSAAGLHDLEVRVPYLSDKKHIVTIVELYHSKSADEIPFTSGIKYLVQEIREESNQLTFNWKHISFAFLMVVNDALQGLDLPEGWSHGGFDSPRFSGVRLRFPSFLIQLYYKRRDADKPLSVGVDFVPVLKVDKPSFQTGVLEDYLQSLEAADWVHLSHPHTDPPLTWYEEQLLSDYHFESVAKTVIRVCKVLCKEASLSTPRYAEKDRAEDVLKYSGTPVHDPSYWSVEGMQPDYIISIKDHFDDTVVTSEDIGENLGNSDTISSYHIKLTVMTLISLDPNKGKSWTSDDIVDLVLTICMVFKGLFCDLFVHYKLMTTKGNIYVPLKRYYKKSHNTKTQITPRLSRAGPKLYLEFSDALCNGNCLKLASILGKRNHGQRIDGILDILRSALYKKSIAKFKIYYMTDDEYVLKQSKWKRLKNCFQSGQDY